MIKIQLAFDYQICPDLVLLFLVYLIYQLLVWSYFGTVNVYFYMHSWISIYFNFINLYSKEICGFIVWTFSFYSTDRFECSCWMISHKKLKLSHLKSFSLLPRIQKNWPILALFLFFLVLSHSLDLKDIEPFLFNECQSK